MCCLLAPTVTGSTDTRYNPSRTPGRNREKGELWKTKSVHAAQTCALKPESYEDSWVFYGIARIGSVSTLRSPSRADPQAPSARSGLFAANNSVSPRRKPWFSPRPCFKRYKIAANSRSTSSPNRPSPRLQSTQSNARTLFVTWSWSIARMDVLGLLVTGGGRPQIAHSPPWEASRASRSARVIPYLAFRRQLRS